MPNESLMHPVKDGIYLRRFYPAFAAFIVAAVSICYGTSAQSRTRPSLELEGTGALVPTSQTCDTNFSCPGNLTAALTGAPFRHLSLDMGMFVNETAGPDSCYVTTGSTELGSSSNPSDVNFKGELCVDVFTYVLRGTLSIIPHQSCQSAPLTVSAGELIAYGAVHTSGPVPPPGGNPIPVNQPGGEGGAIISVIGSTAKIPAPCPSP